MKEHEVVDNEALKAVALVDHWSRLSNARGSLLQMDAHFTDDVAVLAQSGHTVCCWSRRCPFSESFVR